MGIREDVERFVPFNEQEAEDKIRILHFLDTNEDAFERTNMLAHMTASAWAVNAAHDRVLMVYHRIYDSWSWTGGHADGEKDMLALALRELREETGVKNLRPVTEDIYSLEVLTVDGHEKRGKYVSSHLHMNVTYLVEVDELDALTVCEAENSGVRWFSLDGALEAATEPWFVERIYKKLNDKLALYPADELCRGTIADLHDVTELEAACFPAAEAAGEESFRERLTEYPDRFWLLKRGGRLIAAVDGFTTDEPDLTDEMFERAAMHKPDGAWQMIFGVITHPEFRAQGCAGRLLRQAIADCRAEGRKGLVLTCKDRLVPYYSRFGFVNEGVSGSEHGGALWYQMRLKF